MKIVAPRVIRGNRGDLLSRWGILSTLAGLGYRDITVFRSRAGHVPDGLAGAEYGPIYNLAPPPEGRRALARGDVVLWTGGLDLQDDSSLLKLVHTLVVFLSYRAFGLRIVAMMQGVGPLTTRAGRWLARRVLNRVAVFVARDRGSFGLVQELGSRTKLLLAADGIFLDGFAGPPSSAEAKVLDALTGDRSGPLVAVNVRLWFHFSSSLLPFHLARDRYLRRAAPRMDALMGAIAVVIERLRARGARVLLVSMYEPDVEPWEDDLPLLRRLKERFAADGEVRVVEADLTVPGFYALMSRLDLAIGVRLHSTLAALRAGVPALHVSYTLKGRDIFDDLGLGEYAIGIDDFVADPAAAAALAGRLLDDVHARERVRTVVDAAVASNRAILADVMRTLEPEAAS